MNLPPFVYSKKFWEGVAIVIAGGLMLLVYFGVIPVQYELPIGSILAGILAFLRFFGVNAELRARGLLK